MMTLEQTTTTAQAPITPAKEAATPAKAPTRYERNKQVKLAIASSRTEFAEMALTMSCPEEDWTKAAVLRLQAIPPSNNIDDGTEIVPKDFPACAAYALHVHQQRAHLARLGITARYPNTGFQINEAALGKKKAKKQ